MHNLRVSRRVLLYLGHQHNYVRRTAPIAVSEAVSLYPKTSSPIAKRLRALWKEKVRVHTHHTSNVYG